ncbi:MAG: hypothetical protein O3C40_15960 [Planctomycetota bacterium]|nr:hypothetical protein [Planctomycetota bacterium]
MYYRNLRLSSLAALALSVGATAFAQQPTDLAPFEEFVSGMALATGSSCAVKHRRLAPCRSPEFGQVFLERSLADDGAVPIHEASVMIGVFDAVEVGDAKSEGQGCSCDSCLGGKGDGKGGCVAVRKAAADAHKGVFYANDFSYLSSSGGCDTYLGDSVKRLPVGDCWIVDVGGQYRMRYHHEQNINNIGTVPNFLGLTGDDDNFLLHRTRLYLNAEYGSHFRFHGEMLDAASELGSGPPRVIEENRTELQNLFVEFKGLDTANAH